MKFSIFKINKSVLYTTVTASNNLVDFGLSFVFVGLLWEDVVGVYRAVKEVVCEGGQLHREDHLSAGEVEHAGQIAHIHRCRIGRSESKLQEQRRKVSSYRKHGRRSCKPSPKRRQHNVDISSGKRRK